MHKSTSKRNQVSSDVSTSYDNDAKKRKLETVKQQLQNSCPSCTNTGGSELVKMCKEKVMLFTDVDQLSEFSL